MTPPPEVHLVGDANYLRHASTRQMIPLSNRLADRREPGEASRLRSAERVLVEVREDPLVELRHRAHLVLEGAIRAGLADPTASEKALQAVEEIAVLLIERERERRPSLEARLQFRSDGEGHTEASFPFRQTGHVPRLKRALLSIGVRLKARAGVLHAVLILALSQDGKPLLSDQSLRGQWA